MNKNGLSEKKLGFKFNSINEQIMCLSKGLNLEPDQALDWVKANNSTDNKNICAIANWRYVSPNYGLAVKKLLLCVSEFSQKEVINFRLLKFDNSFSQEERYKAYFTKILSQQGEIVILPAEISDNYRRFQAVVVKHLSEGFSFGVFATLSLLIANPRLLNEDMEIACLGDRYAPNNNGDFSMIPQLSWQNGIILSGIKPVDDVSHIIISNPR